MMPLKHAIIVFQHLIIIGAQAKSSGEAPHGEDLSDDVKGFGRIRNSTGVAWRSLPGTVYVAPLRCGMVSGSAYCQVKNNH